jgi:hypothetical protein
MKVGFHAARLSGFACFAAEIYLDQKKPLERVRDDACRSNDGENSCLDAAFGASPQKFL